MRRGQSLARAHMFEGSLRKPSKRLCGAGHPDAGLSVRDTRLSVQRKWSSKERDAH